MIRIIRWITSCMACILICSCTQEIPSKNGGSLGGKSELSISFNIDGLNPEVTNRAKVDPTPEEETVNKLMILFYEASSTYDGRFITSIILDEGPYEMDQSYSITDPRLSPDNAYNIIVIANIDDELYINGLLEDQEDRFSDLTEKLLRERVFLNISFPDESYGISSEWIPMTGAGVKKAGEGKVDINLKRIVSRLDVTNSASGYELKSVSLWNAIYRTSLLGDVTADFSPVPGSRTRKYYDATVTDGKVVGGLYTFENQVTSPAQNDIYTTCVIIGLSHSGATERYFRVNVHPSNSPQHLKRNNAYKVSIKAVNGQGYETEEEAYSGLKSELEFSINQWDLDDNGLIVSDINSMMALPVKTAIFGRLGGENSYTITTFSNLASPAPLSMKSQIYTPADGSITATLTGNILNITAKPLPDGADDRKGIITLSFAGLEASMNVLQSSSVDKYLTVTLDDNWIFDLPPTPHASSENILVNASGPWTAKLYDAEGAFTLQTGTSKNILLSSEVSGNKFRISTFSQNTQSDKREGFVLVSLDDDNLNYVSVIPIAQKVASAINVVPDVNKITFDAAGKVENSSSSTYKLKVTTNGSELSSPRLSDDTHFSLSVSEVTEQACTIVVTTKGENYSGDAYISNLILEDNGGGSLIINLKQEAGGLYLRPSTFSSNISVTGGHSEYITVDAGSSSTITWSATIVTKSENGEIFNHEAFIELSDGTYKGTNPTNVQTNVRFRVVFPKVYYPNRGKNITAEVVVTLDGLTMSQDIVASQDALQSQGIHIWSSERGHWGAIASSGANYCGIINKHILNEAPQISNGKYSLTNNGGSGVNNQHKGGYSDFSLVNICNSSMPANYNWDPIREYMRKEDGLTVFQCDAKGTARLAAINNSPMKDYGYSFVGGPTGRAYSNSTAADTRVYKILFDYARNPIQSVGPFTIDGESTETVSIPSTGVKILHRSGGSNEMGNGMLVIDPTNGFIYTGDNSIYYSNGYMGNGNNNQYEFMYNYCDFMFLASMYGSHFMDMLIDYAPGDPNAVPAPWDDVWGTNKWNPSSMDTIK